MPIVALFRPTQGRDRIDGRTARERVFTGDGGGGSGDFLMASLHRHGFASIPTSSHINDGLMLKDAYIVAAVRCAPPDNKPQPDEISRCLDHLEAEVAELTKVKVVVALGGVAFNVWLRLLKRRGAEVPSPRPAFAHGAVVTIEEPGGDRSVLIGCYHPSRQNTNTGRLTSSMMDDVFALARHLTR